MALPNLAPIKKHTWLSQQTIGEIRNSVETQLRYLKFDTYNRRLFDSEYIPGTLFFLENKWLKFSTVKAISAENMLIEIGPAEVLGGSLGVVADGKTVLPGGYTFGRNWYSAGLYEVYEDKIKVPPLRVRELSGSALVLGIASHFGHFFVDLLDRIAHVDLEQWDWLIVDSLHENFFEWVDTLNVHFDKKRIIQNPVGQSVLCNEVFCLSGNSVKPFWSSETVKLIRSQTRGETTGADSSHGSGALFITREGANKRLFTNLQTIVDTFDVFDFVDTGTYSLNEQIRIFRSYNLILGPIGSDLFNIVFCNPGTKIICLANQDYIRQQGDNVLMLRSLSHLCGLDLIFVGCEPESSGYDSNVTIPINAIDTILSFLGRN